MKLVSAPTQPQLPAGEAPLDDRTLNAFLRAMGTDMVLVGGQALAFWMARYSIHAVPLGLGITVDADMLVPRGDADVLAPREMAQAMAVALGAKVVFPRTDSRTSIVAQIRIPAAGGKVGNVDLLHVLFTVDGLTKSHAFTRRVIGRSVVMALPSGAQFRVMHPIDLLASRAHNAVGLLLEKGPHVVTQAIWAVEVAREALGRTAMDGQGQLIQDVFKLAHAKVGRQLLEQHGVELLDAVPVELIRERSSMHAQQLDKLEQARTRRWPA